MTMYGINNTETGKKIVNTIQKMYIKILFSARFISSFNWY